VDLPGGELQKERKEIRFLPGKPRLEADVPYVKNNSNGLPRCKLIFIHIPAKNASSVLGKVVDASSMSNPT
jgi:hypothetical protein